MTMTLLAILAATLLPLGSEPVLLALLAFYPDLLLPSLLIATLGNTLGGVIGWWMGYGAHHAIDKVRSRKANQSPPTKGR